MPCKCGYRPCQWVLELEDWTVQTLLWTRDTFLCSAGETRFYKETRSCSNQHIEQRKLHQDIWMNSRKLLQKLLEQEALSLWHQVALTVLVVSHNGALEHDEEKKFNVS